MDGALPEQFAAGDALPGEVDADVTFDLMDESEANYGGEPRGQGG